MKVPYVCASNFKERWDAVGEWRKVKRSKKFKEKLLDLTWGFRKELKIITQRQIDWFYLKLRARASRANYKFTYSS